MKRPNYYLKSYFLGLQYNSVFIIIYRLNNIRFYESVPEPPLMFILNLNGLQLISLQSAFHMHDFLILVLNVRYVHILLV